MSTSVSEANTTKTASTTVAGRSAPAGGQRNQLVPPPPSAGSTTAHASHEYAPASFATRHKGDPSPAGTFFSRAMEPLSAAGRGDGEPGHARDGGTARTSPPTRDATASAAYVPMGLRQHSPHGGGGRGDGDDISGGSGAGGNLQRPSRARTTTTGGAGVESESEEASLQRGDAVARARRVGRGTPNMSSLSPQLSGSQQQHQQQHQHYTGSPCFMGAGGSSAASPSHHAQYRPSRRHSSNHLESFLGSSTQMGSLMLNGSNHALQTAGSGGIGRRRHSTTSNSNPVGDSASPNSRHLQPPANHSRVNLFVRDLPQDLNEDKLRGMFSPFGEIVNSAIMRNIHTGVSLGTAFVRFAKHEEALRAMESFAGGRAVAGSKRVTVQWARREHDKAPAGDERRKMRKLFIRNVPKDVTQEMLTALFSQYGPVKSVSTHRDTAAANAVSQPSGAAAEAADGPAAHDAGNPEDRRIAFVTFDMEGVAEQATAAVHNTMPFASCQGIPLMVKLAEDTPVRHTAVTTGGGGSSSNLLHGSPAHGGHLNATDGGGGGMGGSGMHGTHLIGIGSAAGMSSHMGVNATLSWSDAPVADYLATPVASPPAAQLHAPAPACRAVPLPWSGSSRALSRNTAGGAAAAAAGGAGGALPGAGGGGTGSATAAPALTPPRRFGAMMSSAASPSGSPPYAGLTPMQSGATLLPFAAAAAAAAAAATGTPCTVPHSRMDGGAGAGAGASGEAPLDISQTLGSLGLGVPASGHYGAQGMGSGPPDFLNPGVVGSNGMGPDYLGLSANGAGAGMTGTGLGGGAFPMSSYENADFYAILQQYGSSLSLSAAAAAGRDGREGSGSGRSGGGPAPLSGFPPAQDASAASEGRHVSPAPPMPASTSISAATPSLQAPPSQAAKALTVPQPRSGALAQQQQNPAAGAEGTAGRSAAVAAAALSPPSTSRLVPQPRSNTTSSAAVPLSRSAAAAAAAAAANAGTSRPINSTNTPQSESGAPFSATSPAAAPAQHHQHRISRAPATSAVGASFSGASRYGSGGSGGGTGGGNGVFATAVPRSMAMSMDGGAIGGAASLRHGPRATSACSPAPPTRSSDAATAPSLSLANNHDGQVSASISGGGFAAFTLTNPHAGGANTPSSQGVFSAAPASGSLLSAQRRMTGPPAMPVSLPLPPPSRRSSAPQIPPRPSFSVSGAQPTAEAPAPTFTTAPLMAAAARMMLLSDDSAGDAAADLDPFDYGVYTGDELFPGKGDFTATSFAAEVVRAVSGDATGRETMSATSSSNCTTTNNNSQNAAGMVQPPLLSHPISPTARGESAAGTPASTRGVRRRAAMLNDAAQDTTLLGAGGLLDDQVLFEWNGPAPFTGGGLMTASPPSALAAPVPSTPDELDRTAATLMNLPSTPSVSHTQGMLAHPNLPAVGSVSNMWANTGVSAYWGSTQMRDSEQLGRGTGADGTATAMAGTPGAMTAVGMRTTPTPPELSRRSTARTLPGPSSTLLPVGRTTRSDDEDDGDDEQTGWNAYPDLDLNLGWPAAPNTDSRKTVGGGVVGSARGSESSHDVGEHLRYRQLGLDGDNLFNFMPYDDPSFQM